MSTPDLVGCISTFRRWLHLPDPAPLLVVLAAVVANLAAGDPIWMLLVGAVGGGKTELLSAVAHLRQVHPAATLTQASLLSGTPRREQSADAHGGLLREIGASGIILAKDFGSVLSMPRDPRGQLLAALREIFDGSWTRHLGTDGGRTLHWEGKVGLIGACTPAIDSHHGVMSSMGERFVFFRLETSDDQAQARRALAHLGREAVMRAELAAAAESLVARADLGLVSTPPGARTVDGLVALAMLAARCRSAVERDGYSREIQLIPPPEAPGRLALVLQRLWSSVLALGADEPTAWRIAVKCALDSMPAIRQVAWQALLRTEDGVAINEICTTLGYPVSTVRRALEDLAAHGVARRAAQGTSDRWFASNWARDCWTTVSEVSGTESQVISEMSDPDSERMEVPRTPANPDGQDPIPAPDFSELDQPVDAVASMAAEQDYPSSAWIAD